MCATLFFCAEADTFFWLERFCETDDLWEDCARFFCTDCLFPLMAFSEEQECEPLLAAMLEERLFFRDTVAFLCFELERLAETFCLLFLFLE